MRWRDSLVSCGDQEPGISRLLEGPKHTKRLFAAEWNEALSKESILIDARNDYEQEGLKNSFKNDPF